MFYLDLFRAPDAAQVRYVLVGGVALNVHGVERATMDVDIAIALDARNLGQTCRGPAEPESATDRAR